MDYIIETRQLDYAYGALGKGASKDEGQYAVRKLELQVPEGAIFGFLGPNGAGKSTAIKLLLGLLKSQNGQARLFGQPLQRKLLAKVGALIEAPALYPALTARENLLWQEKLFRMGTGRIEELLRLAGLWKAADKKIKHFSMGMKQRLGIAMALYRDPDLLILDEPVNGLDPAGIQNMRKLFLELQSRGKTLFISSHILSEIEKVATHLAIIQHGELRYQGPAEQLRAARRHFFQLQTDDNLRARQLLAAAHIPCRLSNGRELAVEAAPGKAFHRVISCLIEGGLEVHHASARPASLEDVFFELTAS